MNKGLKTPDELKNTLALMGVRYSRFLVLPGKLSSYVLVTYPSLTERRTVEVELIKKGFIVNKRYNISGAAGQVEVEISRNT